MRAFYEDGDKQEISRYLKATLELTGAGLWEWDLDDGSIQGDDRLAEILGLSMETLRTFSLEAWAERVHESERAAFLEAAEGFDGKTSSGFDEIYRMQRGDGRWIWVHDRSGLIRRDALGRPKWLFGVLEDITERHEEQQRWRQLSRSVPGVIYSYHLDTQGNGHFPYTSDKVRDFYNVTPEDIQRDASIVFKLVHPDDLQELEASIAASAETLSDWLFEYRAFAQEDWHWFEGRAIPQRLDDGSTLWHGIIILIDERKRLEESLRRLSVTDELTGLYNRRHLLGCMEEELARFRRFGTPFSLVVIDLDHFKDVNDRYGHGVGDRVLQQLARLFEYRLRDIDVAGRTGGEEFLLVLPGTPAEGALWIAEGLRQAFAAMVFQGDDGDDFRVTLSAGVATACDADERLRHLWARADRALYAAKEAGRDSVIKQ
jgi:diguanylate cyclase (GGDEF)-like protein/PAS domain S-box-containing protein